MFKYMFIPLSILEAYRSGRGRIVVRGKTDVELLDSKMKRSAIIIKEVNAFFLLSGLVMDINIYSIILCLFSH